MRLNRSKSSAFFSSREVPLGKRNISHIVNSYLFADALNFIEAAGPDPSKWRGHNSAEGWSMYILMLMASHPELSAEALREAGVGSVVGPITRHDGLVGTMAIVTMAFLANKDTDFGSQLRSIAPATVSEKESFTSSVIKRVVDLLDSALHRRGGNGYSESTFMLSMVTRAVRCLVLADVSMDASLRNRILDLLVESMEIFISGAHVGNEPSEAGEAECMELILDILGHILHISPGIDVSALGPEGNPYHPESEYCAVMPYILDVIGKMKTCGKSALLKGKHVNNMMKAFLAGRKLIKSAEDDAPSTARSSEIDDRTEEEEATPRSVSSAIASPRATVPKGAKRVAVSRFPSREKASTWAAEQCMIDKLKEIGFEVLLEDQVCSHCVHVSFCVC